MAIGEKDRKANVTHAAAIRGGERGARGSGNFTHSLIVRDDRFNRDLARNQA
jgi:hypothetical protein